MPHCLENTASAAHFAGEEKAVIRLMINDSTGTRVASLPRWAVWLGVAAAAGVGLLIAVIGFSLILVLAPFVIAAGALARWRLRKMLREMQTRQGAPRGYEPGGRPSPAGVIDADYRVVEEARTPEPR
jgi:Flp pilus assembly protein TadB